jgi:hypothetical protein
MYKNGEAALDRILELVSKCPKDLQDTCFELLLSGYVQIEIGGAKPHVQAEQTKQGLQADPQTAVANPLIPPAVLTRLKNTAKRLGTTPQKLESLFDFSVDPFTLHAITLPGNKNADKTRNVALIAASKSYLATGSWSADWQEVKALCVDHS